jgi:hypothetical protein
MTAEKPEQARLDRARELDQALICDCYRFTTIFPCEGLHGDTSLLSFVVISLAIFGGDG